MVFDSEFHLFMPEQVGQATSKSGKVVERYWDPKTGRLRSSLSAAATDAGKFVGFMDEAGIDMALVTTNLINGFDAMKRWNDYCAQAVKQYPRRYIGFASVPPLGGEASLNELDRAINELGLKGVHIWTRAEDKFLDSREMWPFYEKVAKLNVPIDVHVTVAPKGMDFLDAPYGLYFAIGRELDMAGAVMRVCLGGVLEDFPNLKFIMNHFGGGIASVMGRVTISTGSKYAAAMASFYKDKSLITRPWHDYFEKLYFNTAGREVDIGALQCLLSKVSPKKVLFGTDWPFNYDYAPQDVKLYAQQIRDLKLPKSGAEDILWNNAKELFGL
jgi:predicted TIM-barrel fold metal-dependent hydrolase